MTILTLIAGHQAAHASGAGATAGNRAALA